jgi:hypothetical protein
MIDTLDIVKNIDYIYSSNTSFEILKDFERVLDELDLYVYENWPDGELVQGPEIERHWVSCTFMWPEKKMPDPMGGKRLLSYDCKVYYKKDFVVEARKIKTPDDIRPGTKKGKLDRHPVWLVKIEMPKSLIKTIYSGYKETLDYQTDPTGTQTVQPEIQPADAASVDAPVDATGTDELETV